MNIKQLIIDKVKENQYVTLNDLFSLSGEHGLTYSKLYNHLVLLVDEDVLDSTYIQEPNKEEITIIWFSVKDGNPFDTRILTEEQIEDLMS